MHLWRKSITERWLKLHEAWLGHCSPECIAFIRRPGFKRLTIEISAEPAQARACKRLHGGTVVRLERDWLAQFAKAQRRKPLAIGQRLVVLDSCEPARAGSQALVIPSGAAFGTGDHATTAMSLRMLERRSRKLPAGWSLADLGTGSGILSLAAARFGGREIEAIDNDPMAISTAKENARLNRIRGIRFAVLDVKRWRARRKVDVVVANLFSQLLIAALPSITAALKRRGSFIFSGVLRREEGVVVRAIRKSGLQLEEIRRRGKWVALAGRGP